MQDHIEGSVPVVISSQGSNPSPSTEPGAANIQADIQTTMDAAKRKVHPVAFWSFFFISELLTLCTCPTSFQRGRPSKKDGTSAITNIKKRTSFAALQPMPVMLTARANSTRNFHFQTSLNTNTSTNHDSHNLSSSFGLSFYIVRPLLSYVFVMQLLNNTAVLLYLFRIGETFVTVSFTETLEQLLVLYTIYGLRTYA